jgi:molybdopterin synthase catalytic subunit
LAARIQREIFDVGGELARFTSADAGAMANFVGYVRGEGGVVNTLILDHYPGFTEQEIGRIEALAVARFGLIDALIIHRYGAMSPGEPIVLVSVLAAHRKAALQAVDFIMDHLKTDAPFWKREAGVGGERWVEPRADDRAARAHWDERREEEQS